MIGKDTTAESYAFAIAVGVKTRWSLTVDADKVIAPAGEITGSPTVYVLSTPPVVANFACVAPTYKRTSVEPSARVSVTVPSEVARKEWLPLVRNTLIASSPAET